MINPLLNLSGKVVLSLLTILFFIRKDTRVKTSCDDALGEV